jgi:hypothetical protein
MRLFLLLLIIFLVQSCDRRYYLGSISVEQHVWQLVKIDTFFRGGYRPSAIWYNLNTRLNYIDNYNEFPYPYSIGTRVFNFDRK